MDGIINAYSQNNLKAQSDQYRSSYNTAVEDEAFIRAINCNLDNQKALLNDSELFIIGEKEKIGIQYIGKSPLGTLVFKEITEDSLVVWKWPPSIVTYRQSKYSDQFGSVKYFVDGANRIRVGDPPSCETAIAGLKGCFAEIIEGGENIFSAFNQLGQTFSLTKQQIQDSFQPIANDGKKIAEAINHLKTAAEAVSFTIKCVMKAEVQAGSLGMFPVDTKEMSEQLKELQDKLSDQEKNISDNISKYGAQKEE